jgi:TRAP-type C4-dicarboxylate transport system permease small subunit
MKSVILRIDRVITPICLWAACGLLVIASGLGVFQVITRFVFEQPSTWTEEILRRLLIWMVFLGIVPAFRSGALVSVDLMLRLSKGVWLKVVRTVIALITLIFLCTLAYVGFDLVSRVRFQTFSSIEWLSMGWAYLAVPFGAMCSAVAVLAALYDYQNTELETAQ